MKKILFTLFICLDFYSPLSAQNDTDQDWFVYTDTGYYFHFSYPGDWEFKPRNTNTRFFVTSFKENADDDFRENVNCIARNLGKTGFKINDAEEAIIKSLREKLPDFNLVQSGYSTWNNSSALTLEYTCTQEAEGNKYYIRVLQHMAVVEGTLFTLTYTAKRASYEKYLPAVKKMIGSFTVD